MYFAEKDAASEEAEKFFNHYESNGWLVGGKTKMKNWLMNAKKLVSLRVKRSNPKQQKSLQILEKAIGSHYDYTKSFLGSERKRQNSSAKNMLSQNLKKQLFSPLSYGCS